MKSWTLLIAGIAVIALAIVAILWQPASSDTQEELDLRVNGTASSQRPPSEGGQIIPRPLARETEQASKPKPKTKKSRGKLKVMTEADFFKRLRDLGLDPSPETFERMKGQRRDRGALVVLATDAGRDLVSGARVLVEPSNQKTHLHHVGGGSYSPKMVHQSTGSDGLAFFKNLLPGPYLLAVEHVAYLTHYLGSVRVKLGQPTYVEVVLEGPDSTISGWVRDSSGAGLRDVRVRAERFTEGGVPFTASATTGSDGAFVLGVQTETQSSISASKVGYKTATVHGIAAGTEGVEITLTETPTTFVKGHLTRGNTTRAIEEFSIDGESFVDPDGRFRVARNVSGEVAQDMVFAAPGFQTKTLAVSLPSTEEVDLGAIPLFGGKELRGIVLRQGPNALIPVAGANVAVITETGESVAMPSAADGTFFFIDLAEERIRLSVNTAEFGSSSQEVYLRQNEITYVEVILESGDFSASGLITDKDSGDPIEGAQVSVVERPALSTLSDASGAYSIAGIDLEQFTLQAAKSGYRPETSPPLAGTTEGVVWNGQLVPSGLRIRFRLGGGDAPQGVAVVLWKAIEPTLAAAQAAQAALETHRWESVTDAGGTVTFDVEEGPYFVQVVDYRLHPTRVLAQAENREWIDIALPGRTQLSGRIRKAGGGGLANTSFWLHSGDQDYSTMSLYHTDGNGDYQIPNLAPRPYALSIIKSATVQSAQHLVEFVGSGGATQSFNVQLPPLQARIFGTVRDENGVGKGGVQVGVEFLDSPHRSILAGWVITAPNGSYEVPLLEPGRHRVRTTWSEDVSVFSDIITLATTENRQVDLVAPRTRGKHVRGAMIANDGGPLGGNFLFATDSQGRQNGNFFSLMDWGYLGSFDIKGLQPDNYRIDLTAMGCRKKAINLPVSSDVNGLVVVMERQP